MKSLFKILLMLLLIVSCATKAQDREKSLKELSTEYSMLYQQGRYAAAEDTAKAALTAAKKTFRPNHPATARCLNDLALVYQNQGKYAEAEPLYKQALEIEKKALEPDSALVATSLNNLAGIYYAQGKYTEAESLYKQALQILENAFGENHPNVAASLNNLAGLYHAKKDFTSALKYYRKAAAINSKYKFNLIPLLDELEKWQDIIELSAPEVKKGSTSPSLLGSLATAYMQTGEREKSESVILILKKAEYNQQWEKDYRNYILAYYYLWHDKPALSKECLMKIMIPRYLKYARTSPKFKKLFSDPEFLELTKK